MEFEYKIALFFQASLGIIVFTLCWETTITITAKADSMLLLSESNYVVKKKLIYSPMCDVISHIIICLKDLPILYHWNDCAINLCIWTLNFVYRTLTPRPNSSQTMRKVWVLYVYVLLFDSAEFLKSWAVVICPTGIKKKNIPHKDSVKMVFVSKIQLKIT